MNTSKTNNINSYPLYIPSKGRAELRLTSKFLSKIKMHHYIVIEKEEYSKYKEQTKNDKYVKLLILDKKFQDDYDTCDDLGYSKSKGPGPARNFIWQHSIDSGFDWHWTMDDNIWIFGIFNKNYKAPVADGLIFKVMEDFCLRYTNVGMAGPNYWSFMPRKQKIKNPFIHNTRIYSCNLIRNDLPFRWRGRYNEDTILSLDMIKSGWCTIQFNSFLQKKEATQVFKGGNTKEFYSKEGTLNKSKMQVKVHPDCSKLVWRFNRWHHYVDYKRFRKIKLIKKDEFKTEKKGVNNYGMKLVKIA